MSFTADFESWKVQHEHETNTCFVKTSGEKGLCDKNRIYYYCNRSGYFNSKGLQHRSIKCQGTSKIDTYCTAGIVLVLNGQNFHVRAHICTTHYGHEISLGHIRLSKEHRYSIAAKISQGVTFQRVLDDIREVAAEDVNRSHLTTRQDIRNIERSFGLRTAQKHENDAMSVDIWVHDMFKHSEKNPVLVYKPQGCAAVSNCPSLKKDDFMLALQTPLQRELLSKFGNNIVCMDDTHGTNSYDFYLISLLVIDEFGEGCPVGWCVCNRADMYILIDFLMAIKENVGSLKPCWLMTDDAEQFYNAWVAVFGLGPKKLLCIWHVDRAWRKALNSLKDKETAALVYHNLRLLLEESDPKSFHAMQKNTITQLGDSPATCKFAEYFKAEYVKRPDQWAACYRKGSNINTNMYVESFHRLLKHVYMKGKVNKRVDNLLHILIKISRDKAFERLCKLEKGKVSGRLTTIRKRHWASTTLSFHSLVKKSSYREWNVYSSDKNDEYIVSKECISNCPYKCQLVCNLCRVCIHMYTCTCMDFIINHTICKHIHLIAFHQIGTSTEILVTNPTPQICTSEPKVPSSHVSLVIEEDIKLKKIKERLHQTLSKIHVYVETCTSVHDLLMAENHTKSAAHILELANSNQSALQFPTKPTQPGNTKIITQRFHSTRKRRRIKTQLTKPTRQEKMCILEHLKANEPLYTKVHEGEYNYNTCSRY